jgi:hypothetical protein
MAIIVTTTTAPVFIFERLVHYFAQNISNKLQFETYQGIFGSYKFMPRSSGVPHQQKLSDQAA